MASKSKSLSTSFTSFGQGASVMDLADNSINLANEVNNSKSCYTGEVYQQAIKNYGDGIDLYDKLLAMPDIPKNKREAIERKQLEAVANAYELLNKMVRDCGIQDGSIQELLMKDQLSQKKDQNYADSFRRKATDSDEKKRGWRQEILDLFRYNPCSYPDFSDLAGGQEYQRRFLLELNAIQYKNSGIGGRLVNIIFVYGPPGTGKTQLAQSVAGFLAKQGKPPVYIQVTASNIIGPFVGESAFKMQALFEEMRYEAARGRPVILFFDEFDGLIGESNGQKDNSLISVFKNQADNAEVPPEVNSNILIIAASNNPYLIPRDTFSRVSTKYFIGLPGFKEIRFVLNRQMKNIGWDSINLIDLRTTFRNGNTLLGYKEEELLSLRVQRWDESRREEFPPSWDAALKDPVQWNKYYQQAGAFANPDQALLLARYIILSLILPADLKKIEYLKQFNDDLRKLISNTKVAESSGTDLTTINSSFTSANLDNLQQSNPSDNIKLLANAINTSTTLLTDFVNNFFEFNWDDKETFQEKAKEQLGIKGGVVDLLYNVLKTMGLTMDVLDVMSLRFRAQFFSIREIGIVFTNMLKYALDRSNSFRSFEIDSSKTHFNKWLITRRISSNKTYTKDGCKEEQFPITRLIPLNRSTFKDMDNGAQKKSMGKLAKNVEIKVDEFAEFDKLEKRLLDATDQYTPKDSNSKEPITLRYGLPFGLKFDSVKAKTRVSCKVSTDPDMPSQKFSKILVTQRYTNYRKSVKNEIITSKDSAEIYTRTVREFKLPVDSKKYDKKTSEAFEKVKPLIEDLNKVDNNSSLTIKKIIDVMDTAFPTMPIISNTDGVVVETSNLVELIAPAQITYNDFFRAYAEVRPTLMDNAKETIAWAGGVDKIVTLQAPYFEGTLPSSVQDLVIAEGNQKK